MLKALFGLFARIAGHFRTPRAEPLPFQDDYLRRPGVPPAPPLSAYRHPMKIVR
jgi:hypothetical protein